MNAGKFLPLAIHPQPHLKRNRMNTPIQTLKLDEPLTGLKETSEILGKKIPELRRAQEVWKKLPMSERLKPIKQMRAILSDQSDFYARGLAQENGKTELESLSQEVIPVLDALIYLEKNAAVVLGDELCRLKTRQFYFKGKENHYYYEPYGVIGLPTFVFIDEAGIVRDVTHSLPEKYETIFVKK